MVDTTVSGTLEHTELEHAFHTFNRLSSELREAYQGLEQRVASMTAELEEARRARQRAAREAERTASRLKTLLATLPAGVVVIDEAGIIRESNLAAAQLLGAGLAGRIWQHVLRDVFTTPSSESGDWVTCDGRRVTLAASPLPQGAKIILLTDVTETRALQDLVARSQRLSAMGKMAASLAHQIRTPLAGALLYLSQCRAPREETLRSTLLEKGIERLRYLDKLVQDMLVFARGTGPGERVRVADLFRAVYDAATAVKPPAAHLIIDGADALVELNGNRTALTAALTNLVTNAFESSVDVVVTLRAELRGDRVEFTVHDNGPGIAPSIRSRVFEPFFSTRAAGTGLGLAVVKTVAEAHGGELAVDSAPERGTRIGIGLPRSGAGDGRTPVGSAAGARGGLMATFGTILVVEDDRPLQDALVTTLEGAGFQVFSAADGGEALKVLNEHSVDLVVTDVQMQPVDGCELLRRVQQRQPSLPVLMMTAYGTIEQAVNAMREGAVDYLVKPFEADELERRVSRYLKPTVALDPDAAAPVAEDARSIALLELATRVAATDVTVLLTGESGTGKEVVARFVHKHSRRSGGPFVAVNCAAIPDQMLEAMLFGHEKGAFTGASQRSQGKFVQANGGTLLLDEVTEMDLNLQAKLLRVLQEREVEPLGATKPVPLDVRVLATSNRDLEQTVTAGQFREDLYYRLSVFPLTIPPLRERPGDIAALAQRFVVARTAPGRVPALSPAAIDRLTSYAWPGNVRELENVMQRALVLAGGEPSIGPEHLILEDFGKSGRSLVTPVTAVHNDLAGELWEEEARRIVTALESSRGARKAAAVQLGISDRTLRYKLSKMRAAGISVPGDRI